MDFSVLCSEGKVHNYPFDNSCLANMPLDFWVTLTAVHKRNVRRALAQDLDMITDTTWLEGFTKILREREDF
nr:MAG TPA: hypothetical protein [Caudoviricetes sp.]